MHSGPLLPILNGSRTEGRLSSHRHKAGLRVENYTREQNTVIGPVS